jgi:hypothetical protein
VLISTRRNPAASIEAQQVVKLVRNPIVYADAFTATPTAGELALTLLQNGTSALNETYELTVGPLARGGSFALVFGSNATTAIPLFQSAVSVQAAISSGINTITSNISVQENGKGGYIIAFTGRLGLTNVGTELTLDASGIQFIPMRQTTLTINTAEVEDAFAFSGETTITPTLEIELTQSGTPKTIYQGSVTIRKDLITAGSTVPGDRDSYYTKSEANALFVEDSTSNVDATNRKLYNSSGSVFLDWQNSTIGTGATILDLSGTAVTITDGYNLGVGTTTGTKIGVSTSSKLAFFGSAAITQPASTNVVSALVNLGLVASSVTLGNVVSNSTVNVDATAQDLYSGGQVSVDWGGRSLRNSSGTTVAFWNSTALSIGQSSSQINLVFTDSASFNSISFGTGSGSKIGTATAQKIGFWNATPVTQPNQSNVVTALRECGLLAGGPSVSTFGVFPLSSRTLTAVTYTTFGLVPSNNVISKTVAITGCQLNDIVLLGLPSDVEEGLAFSGHVVTANEIHIDALNVTGSGKTQNATTFRITVIGY